MTIKFRDLSKSTSLINLIVNGKVQQKVTFCLLTNNLHHLVLISLKNYVCIACHYLPRICLVVADNKHYICINFQRNNFWPFSLALIGGLDRLGHTWNKQAVTKKNCFSALVADFGFVSFMVFVLSSFLKKLLHVNFTFITITKN